MYLGDVTPAMVLLLCYFVETVTSVVLLALGFFVVVVVSDVIV